MAPPRRKPKEGFEEDSRVSVLGEEAQVAVDVRGKNKP
jgi:hypothetical protein